MSLSVDPHQQNAGLLRFHRSDLSDRKLHVAKSENSKTRQARFFCSLLPALLLFLILTG